MKLQKIFTVINISFFVSFLTVFKVIMGFANTPPGYTYLAVGHYYLDYFEYLQQTAQGMMGHSTVLNQFAIDDPTQTILGWGQYLIIGKIAKLFHLNVVFGYWLSVFILTFLFILSIYFIIKKLLPNLNFLQHLSAWLFCLFATPFINEKFIPYDFWYAPMSYFHRFGGVPHHLLTGFFSVIIIIISANIFNSLKTENVLKLIWKIISLTLFLLLLLTFAPLQVVNLISAICLLGLVFLIKEKQLKKMVQFLSIILGSIFPIALIIKFSHDGGGLFQRAITWETTQQNYPELTVMFLTIGPILIFSILGLRKFLKDISNVKLLLFFYVTFSFLYFYSPLAKLFGTFNGRFLSPSIYILFGSMAILGILQLSEWFGKNNKFIERFLTLTLLGYFIWITTTIFLSFGPLDQTSYLPNPIYNGIKFLNDQPERAGVLTAPDKWLGLIVPVFADKNVYAGRMIFTPDYENKLQIADRFYQGQMDLKEARKFLVDNKIGFVFLNFMEKYSPKNLKKYPFLKIIYEKEEVRVYKVIFQK